MPISERHFQIGDRLRIREWDDMEAEFGLDPDDSSIACEFTFIDDMRYLCGRTFTVSDIDGSYYYSDEGSGDGFNISADMLEYDVSLDPLSEMDCSVAEIMF